VLNQKAQFSINLMLKDKIKKKYQFKKFAKIKKNRNKKNKDKIT
jgi:hypothetical protein